MDVLPPESPHHLNLPIQQRQPRAECSNIGACGGHSHWITALGDSGIPLKSQACHTVKANLDVK